MKRTAIYRHFVSCACAAVLVVNSAACNSPINKNLPVPEKQITRVKPETVFSPEYMQEGFINRDTFRVVIITPASECDESIDSIESKARTRAITSLKHYIETRGWDYSDKTREQLYRLVILNGSVTRMDRDCTTDSVFVYDIRKGNIRNEIDIIAARR